MVGLILVALIIGLLLGALTGRWWALIVAILLPLPLYLGVAVGLWSNGFGEDWQYGIPFWVVPAALGFTAGAMVKNAKQTGS